jgi:hypothetical protein
LEKGAVVKTVTPPMTNAMNDSEAWKIEYLRCSENKPSNHSAKSDIQKFVFSGKKCCRNAVRWNELAIFEDI